MPVVALTTSQIDSGLRSGFSLGAAQFTFSIPTTGSYWETTAGNYTGTNLQPFTTYSTLNATQANNFRAALTQWDNLIAPNFSEVADTSSSHGEVRVAFTSSDMDASTAAYAFQSSNKTPTSIAGDVWINADSTALTFVSGTDGFETLLHELGHVLGLKHPFETPVVPDPYNTSRYTVMAYTPADYLVTFSGGGNSIGSLRSAVNVTTPMVLDIQAVQGLYGADTTYRTGNDTYVFSESTQTLQAIYDAGGIDTLDLTAITRPNVVDLRPGAYSSIAFYSVAAQAAYWKQFYSPGLYNFIDTQLGQVGTYTWTDNLGIAFTTVIENVLGGSGADNILGNDANNQLTGNAGNDTLDGGLGNDTLDGGTGADTMTGGAGNDTYVVDSLSDVVVEASGEGTDTVQVSAGTATDVTTVYYLAANVENMIMTNGAGGQAVVGNALSNLITGTSANDVMVLGDTISPYTSTSMGNDTVNAGGGNDFLFFNRTFDANDVVDGGAGYDTVGLLGPVYTNLVLGATSLTNVEQFSMYSSGDAANPNSYKLTTHDANVAAGQQLLVTAMSLQANETLNFNGSAETNGRFLIFGGRGADTIVGGAGNDRIIAGAGADVLTGGAGNDVFQFNAKTDSTPSARDTITDFVTGDRIDLWFLDANDNLAGSQHFAFIGSAAFSAAGQLRAVQQSPGNWLVEGDTNGDGVADFSLAVTVTDGHALAAGDFLL